ncbi:hypothetical protein CBR_g8588 [Chara braunii]|uniref:Uncharacterized protein n=1 Tax=Chara braunii TaxID=69332 RepID=A0A388JRY7_CHABU|nr:hypothetical protein CBR_g8588 [Chara braunii]|eukprot:GBG60566.1 hypothetical protein CBR_g8588 [Chara braunii]
MQWPRFSDQSITGGRVYMGVVGDDARATMQSSNMDVNIRGEAETQRGGFGGGSAPRTVASPDRIDFSMLAMEDGDCRRPSPNAGAHDVWNGPVEDIAGTQTTTDGDGQSVQGIATAGTGET